ncbi:MAG: hypothetical protein KDD33_01815 [Bdellovibrionales bacterium]|nr:hypothetical protein [Bdellovibrionales bacterium]
MSKKPIKRLAFENLTIEFGDKKIVDNCSFEFPLNRKIRMLFNNDVNKYAVLHAFTQVEGITQGKYFFNEDDVTQFSFEEFMSYRLNMGIGFSTRGLLHNRSLQENLLLPLMYHKMMSMDEALEHLKKFYEYFDISSVKDRRPAEVGPNMQKATLLIRAFIHEPEIVFLDNPEMLLSKGLYANLLQLIDDQVEKGNLKHLFFSTEDEDLSDCIADGFIIVKKNKFEFVENKKQMRLAV